MALDTRPQVVDVSHYGGDTLTIKVYAPFSITTGKDWNAHLKAERSSDVIDATFTITPPAADGDPALLVLESEITSALVTGAPVMSRRGPGGELRSIQQYSGEWDCQISVGGNDPVKTLVQGTLTMDLDVTRVSAAVVRKSS
jgi:hypothetical protein